MNKKEAAIDQWRELPDDVNPLSAMEPMDPDAEGSSYGACGVRIDGSPAFIDLVLGRLKGLLDGENMVTRLHLTRQPVKAKNIGGVETTYRNAVQEAEVCYVRLHKRKKLARPTREFLRREENDPTMRYLRLKNMDPEDLAG